jgi:hexosaminidase
MKLKFNGDLEGLAEGIEILGARYGYEAADDGIPIDVINKPGNLRVVLRNGKGLIEYGKKVEFFRALGLFVENVSLHDNFSIIEEPQFDMNGAMIDVSRNAVLSVDSVKKIIELMAVMGLNMLMLYSEDTYTVDKYPYFGYMRGRYSHDEMKEFGNYAGIFGIEIIPCIQTLAHLEKFLRWKESAPLKDTSSVLLVGEEKVYELIEEMIKSAAAPFSTNRIHLGMDEAWDLGLGEYLNRNGFRRRHDIMNEHVARVIGITEKLGLKPMIWSDMYFRLGSKTGDYYDENADIPDDVVKEVPKGLQLVYWDYYHEDKALYGKFIDLHKRFDNEIIFAGGVWTWNGLVVNYKKTFDTTNAALAACKERGIKEVFATMWGDNGSETNFFSSILGLQLYAEHGYNSELDVEKLKSRFKFCTGGDFDAFWNISRVDMIPGTEKERVTAPSNPSKPLLYQDILIGLFDKNAEGLNLNSYYSELGKELASDRKNNPLWDFVFEVPEKLCSVLSIKSEIGITLKNLYGKGDKEGMAEIAAKVLPGLYERVNELRKAHRKQWLSTYKPFGWEVLDIRYGGVLARIDSSIERITDYIEGRIDKIEELEQERLYFDGTKRQEGVVGRINQYVLIPTACPL